MLLGIDDSRIVNKSANTTSIALVPKKEQIKGIPNFKRINLVTNLIKFKPRS